MLLSNGSAIHSDIIDSFNNAVESEENQHSDGSINWNFVDADMHMDLAGVYSSEHLVECFEALADRYENSVVFA